MRYVVSRLVEHRRDNSYRIYVTDCLQAIANNTTKHVGMTGIVEAGTSITMRWLELDNPKMRPKPKPVDNRDAVEIAGDIFKRARTGR